MGGVMNRRTFGFGSLALLLGGTSPAVEAASPLRTLASGALRIGTYFVNPPFEYLAHETRVGFEIDLMREIARRLGLQPLFVNTRWEEMLQDMQDGIYDCIAGGITITPARERILAWSKPYLTTTLSLVVNTARNPQIRSLADMTGASVGVQAATTDYDAAIAMQKRGQIAAVRVYAFDRIAEAMADLLSGRITVVMKLYPVAVWFLRNTPELRIVAQVPDDPQPLGIGFQKNNPDLRAGVDASLADLRRTGPLPVSPARGTCPIPPP